MLTCLKNVCCIYGKYVKSAILQNGYSTFVTVLKIDTHDVDMIFVLIIYGLFS